MNEKSFELLEKFVPKNYINHAHQCETNHEKEIRILIEKCKLPENGWSDQRIELLLNHLSILDSNNFSETCGVGEREGRVYSNLVSRRHYGFSHGIGRSGDITEVQPKAIGSSILNRLTNELVLDFLKISGLTFIKSCFILPIATGMSLTFSMLSIRQDKPKAIYVLMPRIDQKSCIKSIVTAGFIPVIIENQLVGDELRTDLKELENKLVELGADNVACIMSVTSCFAPRAPDDIENIAKICQTYNVFHLVNNAYGLQSSKCCHLVNQASRAGRVDIVVQSTDKNLMVPVGGSIVASFDEKIINKLSHFYPGRASASQSLDVLVTLLSMGTKNYKCLLDQRKESFNYLKDELKKLAEKYNEKVLETPGNSISIGFSLTNFGENSRDITQIGGMLYVKCVTGVRVVAPGDDKEIGCHLFKNFNSHSTNYPCSYLTAAAAIGIQKSEIDCFIKRLQKALDSNKQSANRNLPN